MGASPSSLSANTVRVKGSNGAPSFECVIGDRYNSGYASNISSVDAPPSFGDMAHEVTSRSNSIDHNLDEVKLEEGSSSTLDAHHLSEYITNKYKHGNEGPKAANLRSFGLVLEHVDESHAEGESGAIKGPRSQLLAPPPISRVTVDDTGSNWDLIRSFAPEDNSTAVDLQYSPWPNTQFDGGFKKWQKGKLLGSGSFGSVYEGFNEHGNFFAVKEVSLLDQNRQGKESIAQLEQEISLLSKFHHDNIVRYLGTYTGDGKLYIFLELVTKGSLAKLYKKYELQDSQVSFYTRQILSGLIYLHERTVVHRDIKCANILVDASGSVKLADFGMAKATTLNDIKDCKGSPNWMAPEVVNNKRWGGYGLASDIWSLGCTVLEMLTRKVPYSHLKGMQMLFKIGRGEPPPIPDTLSAEAKDFIHQCLQVDPKGRPTATQLLEHSFLKRSGSMNSVLASPRDNGMQL